MWDLQPVGHFPPLHTAAPFAETVQGLGHEHQDKPDDPDAMPKQLICGRDMLCGNIDRAIQSGDEEHGQERQPKLFVASKHRSSTRRMSQGIIVVLENR